MSKIPLTLQSAQDLLFSKMQNQNLRRHCMAVGKTLRQFHEYYSQNHTELGKLTADQWEIVGLLHDSDYEVTKDNPEKHVLTLIEWMNDYDAPEELIDALKTHNSENVNLKKPQTLLEWTLECCDELTGFIVAVALVMPGKKLAEVTIEAVGKKMKQKEFSRAVDRHQIEQCNEKVNLPLKKFIEITLSAMQKNSGFLEL